MLFDHFKQVKAFIFAIDGVCTDGSVWVSEQGERWFRFYSKDWYALQLASQHYPVALVGDMRPRGMAKLIREMGQVDLFFDTGDQSQLLRDWVSKKGLEAGHVLYMGSDIADFSGMAVSGFGTCPADAAEDMKAAVAYISHRGGGAGAVRDVIEKVMKLHGKWNGNNKTQSV